MSTAYFYNGGAFGHINPTLGLVAELVARGEDIIYYATEEFRSVIEATGATFRPYHIPPPTEDIRSSQHLAVYLLRWGALLLPGLLEQARAERPEYILFDHQRPWGRQIAELMNVP